MISPFQNALVTNLLTNVTPRSWDCWNVFRVFYVEGASYLPVYSLHKALKGILNIEQDIRSQHEQRHGGNSTVPQPE